MQDNSPYQYYDGKLGVKIKFLITDADRKHPDSLCLIKYNTLYVRLKSKTSCWSELRRASFGADALILHSSLDRQTKDAITLTFGKPEETIKKSWFAQHYVADSQARDFYLAHTYGDDKKKLDLKYVDLYTYNASVLNTVLAMKNNRKAYMKALNVTSIDIWQSLSNDVNSFREVEHNLPSQKDALRRKVKQYQKEGYISLISGKLITRNAAKISSDEQMALLDELLAKHTNLDNETICQVFNSIAERLNWSKITAPTVANRKTVSNLTTFAGRNGSNALSNKVLMQTKRSKPSLPMLYWTMDGWDAELLYQKTSSNDKGHSVTTYHNRLTMVVVLDPFNKYPVGYAIGTHETPELIKQALLSAVLHTKELFGDYYKVPQLQTDNYSIKTLQPVYEACCKYFTPARVKNAKSKVIEPYFNYINKKYCQMFDNWSGFGIASGSKNQPNDEMLNKLRHTFPDEAGCRSQLESIIFTERQKKHSEFVERWSEVSNEHKLPFSKESLLLTLGSTTNRTNQLTGKGLEVTIDGKKMYYECFDQQMRQMMHVDWKVYYNPFDHSEAIAVSPKSEYRFELEQQYIQPMAIVEQTENDGTARQRIKSFNKEIVAKITNDRKRNHEILRPLLENPLLNDTLGKHLLVNSAGQHKDQRNEQRSLQAKAEKVLLKQEAIITKEVEKTWHQQQDEYAKSKLDLTKYAQL